MPPFDEVLQEATRLVEAGKKQQAARNLVSVLKENPTSERGWWLLAACLDDPAKKRDCLKRVLMLNPQHIGARIQLGNLDMDQGLPAEPRTSRQVSNPPPADDPAYANTAPFEETLPPVPFTPDAERLMEHALAAEERGDFSAAYGLYNRVLEQESGYLYAWLGKGYAAGRLSDGENNRYPEFFECLSRAALAQDPLGLTLADALAHLDVQFAQATTDSLHLLAEHARHLAETLGQPAANIYALERVKITDWGYTILHRPGPLSGLWCSRAELVNLANETFERILRNTESLRSGRIRQDTIKAMRNLLLNNLSTSGIDKDPDFIKGLEQIEIKTFRIG